MAKPPRELEAHWYATLQQQGFVDIEDCSREDRPLKSWQSWQFIEEKRFERKGRNEEYQSLAETFLHRQDFDEICVLVVKQGKPGGQPEVSSGQARTAWERHCEGLTERQIAEELKRSKTCVHKLLDRLRAWMKLA